MFFPGVEKMIWIYRFEKSKSVKKLRNVNTLNLIANIYWFLLLLNIYHKVPSVKWKVNARFRFLGKFHCYVPSKNISFHSFIACSHHCQLGSFPVSLHPASWEKNYTANPNNYSDKHLTHTIFSHIMIFYVISDIKMSHISSWNAMSETCHHEQVIIHSI